MEKQELCPNENANEYITADDLADDLFRFVKEYYCGRAEKRGCGFTLADINGKTYEVSVKERT